MESCYDVFFSIVASKHSLTIKTPIGPTGAAIESPMIAPLRQKGSGMICQVPRLLP